MGPEKVKEIPSQIVLERGRGRSMLSGFSLAVCHA